MPSRRTKAAASSKAKKMYTFAKVARPEGSSPWTAGKRRAGKKSKATFELVRAEYQKGEKVNQFTGNIRKIGKPRFGNNDAYKKKMGALTLAEKLRWNDDLQAYTVKVYTAKQARKMLKVAREIEGGDEDLPEDVDETVVEEANRACIDLVPVQVEDEEMLAVMGTTFPWKDELKERGFKYDESDGTPKWMAPKESVDQDDLISTFEDYGFTVEVYDGVEPDNE